jgi:hypothetical protein
MATVSDTYMREPTTLVDDITQLKIELAMKRIRLIVVEYQLHPKDSTTKIIDLAIRRIDSLFKSSAENTLEERVRCQLKDERHTLYDEIRSMEYEISFQEQVLSGASQFWV